MSKRSVLPLGQATAAIRTDAEKGIQRMETNADGTYFQEGDHVRIKRTGKTGRINAADGGVVYMFLPHLKAHAVLLAPTWLSSVRARRSSERALQPSRYGQPSRVYAVVSRTANQSKSVKLWAPSGS